MCCIIPGRDSETNMTVFSVDKTMQINDELTQMAMLDCKSKTDSDRVNSSLIGLELVDLVEKYAEIY